MVENEMQQIKIQKYYANNVYAIQGLHATERWS